MQLGFVRRNPNRLMVVALAGGDPRQIASEPMGPAGAFWASDGVINFDGSVGLDRIRPDGAERSTVATLDRTRQETGYAWPEVLPGNESDRRTPEASHG